MYLLLKLALFLSVSTATVEKVFSSMKYIKTNLRNRISDELLNDTIITFDIAFKICCLVEDN